MTKRHAIGMARSAAQKFMSLTPEAAKNMEPPITIKAEMTLEPKDVQRFLDAMKRAGMLTKPITAADMSIEITY
jgi:hypothetical protein